MSSAFNRKGPDGPQKVFLYLILLGWLMLIWLTLNLQGMSARYAVISSGLLLVYNLLMVGICFRRARRTDDGYLIYPVVGSAIGSYVLTAWYFFS
ncbi:hypothetical protein L2725_14805 [Shewanella corallii]|uniref:Uncharacterized protein n=2 Tax=Shewanella TaxID=22 RepID=A0ABT0N975_9GAMM|nr:MULTISPECIES: hypothetical protein [Shewanella]MCL1038712.1 hypothetical protein [Shewanella submarina]MCL2915028.1 hypothetical protein [Shewanella corallii]